MYVTTTTTTDQLLPPTFFLWLRLTCADHDVSQVFAENLARTEVSFKYSFRVAALLCPAHFNVPPLSQTLFCFLHMSVELRVFFLLLPPLLLLLPPSPFSFFLATGRRRKGKRRGPGHLADFGEYPQGADLIFIRTRGGYETCPRRYAPLARVFRRSLVSFALYI